MSYASRQFAKSWINHYSRKDTNHHIKGSDSAANRRTLVVVPFSAVIDDRTGAGRLDTFTTTADTELDLNTAANWDTVDPTDYTVAATRAGKDFYIYACIQGGNVPKILLSAASTYPSGYTATNSRKIGGFHVLPGACVNLPVGHPYKDFEQGAILFNSIWDLADRPNCAPEGMAKISLTPSDGKPAAWGDIYLASGVGATLTSVFGATIQDTTKWHYFVDYAALQGKTLFDDAGFQVAATGSNELTAIAGGADPVTVTFPVDTAGRSMISNYGLIGMTGVMWQFLREYRYEHNIPQITPTAATQVSTITYVAELEGHPVYYKPSPSPHLCAAIDADVWILATTYKFQIQADADPATGGVQVYFDDNATGANNRLLAATLSGADEIIHTNHPAHWLVIKYNATPATPGTEVRYDDVTHNRLESINAGATNANIDLVYISQPDTGLTFSNGKGGMLVKNQFNEMKMAAGGTYNGYSPYLGSCARMLVAIGYGYAYLGCRYCCGAA